MQGVCRTWVLMLGGSHTDQEMEGDSFPWSNCQSHACRGGMQGVFRQEAEVLSAGVVKKDRQEEAGHGRQGG